ncbi:MAG: ADP-ribosylglycohydrolase family protein [Firmicutes bacterium]|jgi:ADP-ribosylglycohydrolase|nr:ADP-ribosylglycohydrolase family protein [Bacillota bacterium]
MTDVENLQMTLLFKKAFGTIIGGAIGDALGGPIETMHYKFIREYHGGRVEDLIDYDRPPEFFQPQKYSSYAWSSKAGTYTDDTYFQLLITKAIVKKMGRITADDLLEMWRDEADYRRAWASLSNSYAKIVHTRIPAREIGIGNIPDNSSPMSIGPIGVINACNPQQAALDAYDVISLCHDGHSREAAAMLAAAVAEAMKPNATIEGVVEAAIRYLPHGKDSKMYSPMIKAMDLADQANDTEELTELFYDQLIIQVERRSKMATDTGRMSLSVEPMESVPCAIAMFYREKGDFRKSVIASANFGRDCDTIACMTGYIAGAFNGVDGIPAKWVETSLKVNPEPNQLELAVGLAKAVLQETNKMKGLIETIEGMV